MINKFVHAFQAAFFGLLYLLIIFAVFLITFFILSSQTIFPGIKIASIPVGGKTIEQASETLENEISLPQERLILKYNNEQFPVSLQQIAVAHNFQKSAENAFLWGKSPNPLQSTKKRFQALQIEVNLPLEIEYSHLGWKTHLATISAEIEKPAIPPTIKIAANQVIVQKGQQGRKIKKDVLRQRLEEQLAYNNYQPISIPVKTTFPEISQKQAEQTKQRAEKLLNKKILLSAGNRQWQLSDKEMINFLAFDSGFKQAKLASWTAQLAKSVQTEPQDALFRFQEGKVVEFKPAKKGQSLAKEKTQQMLKQAIEELAKSNQQEQQIKLPLKYTNPEVTTRQVNNLGIEEPIGKGFSFFRGSSAGRIYNVDLASQRISSTLLPPGETFSFNNTLGEVSHNTGYKQAYVIKKGKTVLGNGGGVCQVSTTLFRAALNSGLKIIERHPHAYRVHYYEQNSPPGLDATVFAPSVDLKFKNNTDNHILIQRQFNQPNRKLSFLIYGKKDGRQVSTSEPRVWDQTPPPPDLYQDDPNLPKGTTKQIEWKAWGAKVAFDYQVTKNGETLSEKTFYSAYQPWGAVFLKGTGGQ